MNKNSESKKYKLLYELDFNKIYDPFIDVRHFRDMMDKVYDDESDDNSDYESDDGHGHGHDHDHDKNNDNANNKNDSNSQQNKNALLADMIYESYDKMSMEEMRRVAPLCMSDADIKRTLLLHDLMYYINKPVDHMNLDVVK